MAEALHALQPLSVPGWAFCWLTAIAHRSVMPRLLLSPTHHGWTVYEHLLVDLLRFLDPYLRASSELTECVRALYKGTLRLLLVSYMLTYSSSWQTLTLDAPCQQQTSHVRMCVKVVRCICTRSARVLRCEHVRVGVYVCVSRWQVLLHDFPEFLCEHYFPLCNTIPVSCVQLRNLVLSAFPRNMRLPDPFTPGLKVGMLVASRGSIPPAPSTCSQPASQHRHRARHA